eukprot:3143119-Pleurochrysis_carterae.AAC.1
MGSMRCTQLHASERLSAQFRARPLPKLRQLQAQLAVMQSQINNHAALLDAESASGASHSHAPYTDPTCAHVYARVCTHANAHSYPPAGRPSCHLQAFVEQLRLAPPSTSSPN